MKNIFRNILIVLTGSVMMFGAAGCVTLDKYPTNSYSEEKIWQNGVLAQATVNGVYNALYYKYCTPNAWEARATCTDTYSSVMDIDANWQGAGMVGTGSLNPSNGNNYTIFKWLFSIVYRANIVISNIDSVPEAELTAAKKDLAKMEATFMRAWAYYQMSYYWGGVPIYTEAIVEPSTATKERSTVEQVLKQVETDLTSVINSANVPLTVASGERASKAAAYAYRGYVYQMQGEYAKALADFEKIGTECKVSLYSPNAGAAGNQDYKDLLTMQHEDAVENIFAIACIGKSGMGNPRARNYSTRIHGGSGWGNYLPNPAYVERFENADGTKFNWETYIPGYTSMTPNARSVYFLRNGLNGGSVPGSTWQKDGNWCLDENGKWLCSDKKKIMEDFGSDFTKYDNSGNEARITKVYTNRDPRLIMKMIVPYGEFLGYTSATGTRNFTLRWPYCLDTGSPYDIRTDTNSMFYYLWRTYTHESNEWTDMWFSPNNIRLVRYAEILLRKAECQVELGQYQDAIDNINLVRKRAGMVKIGDAAYKGDYSAGSAKKLMDLVRNEMYVELGGEDSMWYNECRWTDRDKKGTVEWTKFNWAEWKFKRHDCNAIGDWNSNGLMEIWGVLKYKHIAVDYFKNYGYYWPFPITEIQMNPNCKQTEGWVN